MIIARENIVSRCEHERELHWTASGSSAPHHHHHHPPASPLLLGNFTAPMRYMWGLSKARFQLGHHQMIGCSRGRRRCHAGNQEMMGGRSIENDDALQKRARRADQSLPISPRPAGSRRNPAERSKTTGPRCRDRPNHAALGVEHAADP